MSFTRSSSSMPARRTLFGRTRLRLRNRASKTRPVGKSLKLNLNLNRNLIRRLKAEKFQIGISSLAIATLLLAGCATQRPAPLHLTGDPIKDGEQAIESGPEKDKVLWQYRLALTYMRQGKF